MENITQFYNSWPWLVQSLIGAAIFLILQKLGTKVIDLVSEYSSKLSRHRRIIRLRNELARLNAVAGNIDNRTFAISVLLFRTLRQIVIGFIWVALGLIFNSIAPILGFVGFIGGLYYFFSALTVVALVDGSEDTASKMEEIDKELTELEKNENT